MSVQTECDIGEPAHSLSSVEGIDVGIEAFAATADGELFAPVNAFKFAQAKLG